MAIFHLNLKTIGRSQGRSATGSAAYRAGEVIHDRRTGLTFDYTRKKEIDGADILAPPNAPGWSLSRAELWNRVEEAEKRKDAQLCREVEFALPVELTPEQNKQLARDFIRAEFVALGMAADLAFHKLTGQNPHAHALLTMRTIMPEGFGPKVREWNERSLCDHWRERWTHFANQALAAAGQAARIDHRTLAEQALVAVEAGNMEQAKALDRAPTIHEARSPAAANHNNGVQAANLAGLDSWEALEREAMAEARLMLPYTDARTTARQPSPKQLDEAYRLEMSTVSGMAAAKWRAADRRCLDVAKQLAAHNQEEARRKAEKRKAAKILDQARARRALFLRQNPEPWRFWIFNSREWHLWQKRKQRKEKEVKAAKQSLATATLQLEAAALLVLEKETAELQRTLARTLAIRKGLGLLPSETHLQQQQRRIERQEMRQEMQQEVRAVSERITTPRPQPLPPSEQISRKPKPPGMR